MAGDDHGFPGSPSDGGDGRRVHSLIKRVYARGFVTIAELRSVLPEEIEHTALLDVIEKLHALGIDIIDEPRVESD